LPDLNVWLALSWANHRHSDAAWAWFSRQETFELDAAFRAATRSVSRLLSPKALGDGYLLAVSQVTDATLACAPSCSKSGKSRDQRRECVDRQLGKCSRLFYSPSVPVALS
jgi:hypothetical protein